MARARLLKPGFFTNAKLGALPPHCRLLFAGLWTLADREGRLKDEPLAIKGAVFPFEAVDADDLMKQLARAGFIRRYKVKAERYVQIVNFLKHQTPHIKEAPSTIPAPDEHSASTGISGTSRAGRDPVSITVSDPERVGGSGALASPEGDARPPSGVATQWDVCLAHYRQCLGELDQRARNEMRQLFDRCPSSDWVLAAINQTTAADEPGFGYFKRTLEDCLRTGKPPAVLSKTRRLSPLSAVSR